MPSTDEMLRRENRAEQVTGMTAEGASVISNALTAVLADLSAPYVKTGNFHCHMTGPHFRDYHRLLDEQGAQVLATVDPAAERVRKLGRPTLRSVGHIARLQRVADNDAESVAPADMLTELRDDNNLLASTLRDMHDVCDCYSDVATASLIENWIDETEGRIWFLAESVK